MSTTAVNPSTVPPFSGDRCLDSFSVSSFMVDESTFVVVVVVVFTNTLLLLQTHHRNDSSVLLK